MKILDIRCLRGPNYWSVRRHKLVLMKLDLEELEEQPTNLIPGFYDRLRTLIPSLYEHQCSEGHPGGFFERVQDGTWMGHVIEHIALEIQSLAGMNCAFGQTRGAGPTGVYNIVFAYREERAGLHAARAAVAIAEALIEDRAYPLQQTIQELRNLCEADQFGPSTAAIVEACVRKGVPFIRLDDSAYVQLGYGAAQKRIQSAVTNQTSAIALDLASDKAATKQLLDKAGIPVPKGEVVQTESDLEAVLRRLNYPLVVKPLDGNHGRGVTTNIRNTDELMTAFARAKAHSQEVVVEAFITGNDYRLLVVNHKLVAAALRLPACVVGDGRSSIQQLIDAVNGDARRGEGHLNVLTRIVVDEASLALLREKNRTLDSVLDEGEELCLKKTANLSTGGTATDVTDLLHPDLVFMAERVARIIGLDICGIDLMAQDITQPLAKAGAAVIEVNAGPGLRMHTHPSEGKPRDVGKAIADMLFPGDSNGRIPIIGVTGTNGKTTTTRLTAHLMRQAGFSVGYTTTDGVYVNDYQLEEGDCTGPLSAGVILRDPAVEVAVLECARGGMLRAGLAFDECDVAIVTNVAEDHIGLGDIHTIEQMAHVKSVLPETVKRTGLAILNADNRYTYAMRERLDCNVALFSVKPDNERINAHCRAGGLAAVLEDGFIVIRQGNRSIPVADVRAVPLTFDGKALFMVENCLGAVLAAYQQGLPIETIAEGLRTFEPSGDTTPGRMNLFAFPEFTMLVDYAHNPHGLTALGGYIRQTEATHKVGIITGVGDRRDGDIIDMGIIAAELFDEIIIRLDDDLRGREQQAIVGLLKEGIQNVDPEKPVVVIEKEAEALQYAIEHARPGCLVVHLTEKISQSIAIIQELRMKETQRRPVLMEVGD